MTSKTIITEGNIGDNEILCDFLDELGQPKNDTARQIKIIFNSKFREIQNFAEDHHICAGEALTLINKSFGYKDWSHIPFGKLPEVLQWFKNNYHRRYKILCPQYHEELIKSNNEYSNWWKSF
jgi:hypothetical protein